MPLNRKESFGGIKDSSCQKMLQGFYRSTAWTLSNMTVSFDITSRKRRDQKIKNTWMSWHGSKAMLLKWGKSLALPQSCWQDCVYCCVLQSVCIVDTISYLDGTGMDVTSQTTFPIFAATAWQNSAWHWINDKMPAYDKREQKKGSWTVWVGYPHTSQDFRPKLIKDEKTMVN